jgi:zinc protease
VLDNGLVAIAKRSDHAPVATFWVWYRVGSRNELPGRTGVSHWVEHMLFKGSEGYPKGEIDRLVAREGGVFNAMTWIDWTAYYTTLPAHKIDLAIDLEADRMVGALFDADEVASERTVVISEREGHENSPHFLLTEEVQSSAIKVHPYHHEVIGWKTDLETMTRDDLYGHYRRHYHPGNAVAVAVGPYDPADLLDRVSTRFGRLPAGLAPEPVTIQEPEQRGERRVEVTGEDETSFVVVAFGAPRAADENYFAFQVLDTILGGAKSMNLFGGNPSNRSSRLYRALVETEMATAVSSGMAATLDPFLFTITAVVRADRSAAEVEDAIHREVARIREGGVSEDELARARKQARAQFAYSAESVTNQGFWLGFADVLADQVWLNEHLARLEAVTIPDVAAVAERYFDERKRTVGTYRPVRAARS